MIKRSSHRTARHRDAGRPTGEAARDALKLLKSIAMLKADTIFLLGHAVELTCFARTVRITQASEQLARTEIVASHMANGYVLIESSFRS